MPKYKKSSDQVEAKWLSVKTATEVKKWCSAVDWGQNNGYRFPIRNVIGISIPCFGGEVLVPYDRWVIKAGNGEISFCEHDNFKETYKIISP